MFSRRGHKVTRFGPKNGFLEGCFRRRSAGFSRQRKTYGTALPPSIHFHYYQCGRNTIAGRSVQIEKREAAMRFSVPRQRESKRTPFNGHFNPSDSITVSGCEAKTLIGILTDDASFQVLPDGKTGSNTPESVMMDTWQPALARMPGVSKVLLRNSNLVACVSEGPTATG